MNKVRLIIMGYAFALLIGCSTTQTSSPPLILTPTALAGDDIYTPQSDGGTDAIEADLAPQPSATPLKPTATAIVLSTIAAPTEESKLTATLPPPGANLPIFGAMQFVETEDGVPLTEFVSPNEVFVQFEYANVRDGSVIRRDWYINDTLFISREEAWNSEAFGEEGVRTDISIFDFESGLTPGSYRVELFLNGNSQGVGEFLVLQQQGVEPVAGRKFSNLSFKSLGPYSMEVGDTLERPTEMFAEWFYEDMSASDVVRRDWYYNDELFITREETWDLAALGGNGRIDTVSIFDYETGLLSGSYRLELFVNGEFQVAQSVKIVDPYQLSPLTEPVSGKQLLSDNLNTVTVINPDGSAVTQAVAGRIHSADWFPGGDRLIFAATTLTDPTAPFPLFAHSRELWLWDLSSNQLTQLGTQEARYHSPRVSPDGRQVAVLAGTGYGDAGVVDLIVVVFQFDETGAFTKTVSVTDLVLPEFDLAESFPWTVNQDQTYRQNLVQSDPDWVVSPGSWIDGSTLRTSLGFGGIEFDRHGIYDLNFIDLTARKIE